MKKLKSYLLALLAVFFLQLSSLGQEGNPPPGPCNFAESEHFCFTNSSNQTVDGIPLSIDGCEYEICVKIKPKPGCPIICEMGLDMEGYYLQHCFNVNVGETHCFDLPVPSHPITDCFTVDITMKVVNHTQTLVKELQSDFSDIGEQVSLHNHCLIGATWYSVLERTNGNSGSWNFKIITIGLL